MTLHRVFVGPLDPPIEGEVEVLGEEAGHAIRAKRLGVREKILAFDGMGRVSEGEIVEATRGDRRKPDRLRIRLGSTRAITPVFPRVEVFTAVPKGDRLERMLDQLSQVGAACWGPLACDRSVQEGAPAKRERLERIVLESAKQCGRAWLLELGEGGTPEQVCVQKGGQTEEVGSVRTLVCDARGAPYRPTRAGRLRLLVGPEGGWSGEEEALFAHHEVERVSLTPHTMRVETAAVVAAGVVLHSSEVWREGAESEEGSA